MKVNAERLRRLLDEANCFGVDPSGGITRPGYTAPDAALRRWAVDTFRAEGLTAWQDGVGNVFGRWGPSKGPCVMAGSHLDSVPHGGRLDGVLGVVAALEAVLAMRDAGVTPRIAVEVVGTAEEEGRFGGMLGSQAIAGIVSEQWLATAKDADGKPLAEAMAERGFDARAALGACRRDDVAAFVELHIEQGPVLEQAGDKIGVVTSISGTANPMFTLHGKANHSGTTPMALRKDAVAAFAEIAVGVPKVVAAGTVDAVLTIGKLEVHPNFAHTVPGQVRFCCNIRDSDTAAMRAMQAAFTRRAEAVCATRGLGLAIDDSLGSLDAVKLDDGIQAVIYDEASRLLRNGKGFRRMPSGAGHDAQNMQAICPSGMIFIPSIGGVSHSPEEDTEWDDVLLGAQLLLNTVARLARSSGSAAACTSRL